MKRNLIIAFLLPVIFLSAQDHLVWIMANPDTIYFDNNLTYSNIEALVEDDDNNPVSGAVVWFDCDIGSLIHYAATDTNGIAETTFWESGDLGVATITVERNGEYLETQVTIIMPVASQDEEISALITNLSNHPNPFNPETTIKFTAEDAENAEIIIYNIKGQKIKQYSILNIQSSIVWDGTDENNHPVGSGIYFYKLKVDDKTIATKKCLLLK